MSTTRTAVGCALLLLFGCRHEEAPTTVTAPPETAQAAPAPAPAPPTPTPAAAEVECETPGDCVALTAVCPRPHPHNAGDCLRPYAPTGEHLLGVCQNVHCETDDQAECDRAAARCVGGGTATFQAYDPPDPNYRRGACTVRCNAYPDAE